MRDPAGALRMLRAMAANSSDLLQRQQLLERHREDVLYSLPHSRVGTNFLREAARTPCFLGSRARKRLPAEVPR